MIAINIGRKFLRLYNQETLQNYTAKAFFEKEYFDLFYNHNKYMQWVTNSPFVQMKKGQKVHLLSPQERLEKLENLHNKVEECKVDASTAIGFPASEEKEFATTSGQVSNLNIGIQEEDIYHSWIGSGLGIGVSGGLCIFFEEPKILMLLYEGWKIYRQYLNNPINASLKGNQINTWNGQWLNHVFDKRKFKKSDPTRGLDKIFNNKQGSGTEIKTQSWVQIALSIALNIPKPQLNAYVYSLGQTNTTVGFIPFHLPQIRKPAQLYKKLFYNNDEEKLRVEVPALETLYGTAFGFKKACQLGTIGVQALEPKGIRDYFITGKKSPNYNKIKDADKIKFRTYITWIIAMLNQDEVWEEAGKIAKTFCDYQEGAQNAKKDRANKIQAIFKKSNNKTLFLDNLETLFEDEKVKDRIENIGKLIHKMPLNQVPYFLTLIKFRYRAMEANTDN